MLKMFKKSHLFALNILMFCDCFKSCYFFLSFVTCTVLISGTILTNLNINYVKTEAFFESNLCHGVWCSYAKKCISNIRPIKDDPHMVGLCNLLITDMNYALNTNLEASLVESHSYTQQTPPLLLSVTKLIVINP